MIASAYWWDTYRSDFLCLDELQCTICDLKKNIRNFEKATYHTDFLKHCHLQLTCIEKLEACGVDSIGDNDINPSASSDQEENETEDYGKNKGPRSESKRKKVERNLD